MRFIPRFVLACGLLAICSCSRSDSDQVAKLKAELDAAKAEAAGAKAELAKLTEAIKEQEGKRPALRSGPRMLSGGAPSLGPGPGKPFPQITIFQWQDGLTFLLVEQPWARTSRSGDFYSQAGGAWDAAGDQRYEWHLRTADGKTATFRIVPGKEYDLSKGAVFVIKASGDKVEVHQLSRQLPTEPIGKKVVEEYIKNDAEIRKVLGAPDVP
jgi:hypothetical protein